MIRSVAIGLICLALGGCAQQWAESCQSYGYPPGTLEFAGCMERQQAMFSANMNQLSANMTAISVANTPRYSYGSYNVWVH